MQGQTEQIARDIKDGNPISFGGEYSFLPTDNYEVALEKLHKTGCQIGGSVAGNGHTIKCYPCYDHGYWQFDWIERDGGVRRISYWTAETASINDWTKANPRERTS